MTEQEAKMKWCPFVRHFNALFQPCGNSLSGAATEPRLGTATRCIGSACMAWRWFTPDQSGYCGLAGKP